jgi:hypothetical protein
MARGYEVEGLVLCKRGGGSSPLGRIKNSCKSIVFEFSSACDLFVIAYKTGVTQVVTHPNISVPIARLDHKPRDRSRPVS